MIVEFADDCHTGWDLTSFFFLTRKHLNAFPKYICIKKDHNIAWVGNNCINILIVEFRCLIYGAIHKRRRNILGGEGGSQISMLQDIRR